jgi:hypothetical protein
MGFVLSRDHELPEDQGCRLVIHHRTPSVTPGIEKARESQKKRINKVKKMRKGNREFENKGGNKQETAQS